MSKLVFWFPVSNFSLVQEFRVFYIFLNFACFNLVMWRNVKIAYTKKLETTLTRTASNLKVMPIYLTIAHNFHLWVSNCYPWASIVWCDHHFTWLNINWFVDNESNFISILWTHYLPRNCNFKHYCNHWILYCLII